MTGRVPGSVTFQGDYCQPASLGPNVVVLGSLGQADAYTQAVAVPTPIVLQQAVTVQYRIFASAGVPPPPRRGPNSSARFYFLLCFVLFFLESYFIY